MHPDSAAKKKARWAQLWIYGLMLGLMLVSFALLFRQPR
jgi:hypothetical protein